MKEQFSMLAVDGSKVEREAANFAAGIPQFLAQSWQGTLFSEERNSMKLTESAGVSAALEEAVRKEIGDVPPEQIKLLLEQAKAVLLCFLQTKEIITSVDERGLADLTRIAIASCKDPAFLEDLEIRIGFGSASLSYPNARIPAYAIGAKKILESLSKERERAEMLAELDLISSEFPLNKYSKLRTNLLFSRPLSEEQTELLSEMQKRLESTITHDERQKAAQNAMFPKNLPKVLLYSAHNFVGRTNGQFEAVSACAARNRKYLEAFIQEACVPKIAERFEFDEDRKVEDTTVLANIIEYFAYTFRETTDERTIQSREKVLAFGRKHAGDNDKGSLNYGVSHVLYSADAVQMPTVPMLEKAKAAPKKLLMIGGEPEKVFWKVRQAVCREATLEGGINYFRSRMEEIGVLPENSGYPESLKFLEENATQMESDILRVQFISKVGDIPVYSGEMAAFEPSINDIATMSLRDIQQANMGRSSVKEDLLQLIADLGGVSPSRVKSIAKKECIDTSVLENMEYGLQRLISIAKSVQ